VIDSGNGQRAVFQGTQSTEILVRTSGRYYYLDSIYTFSTFGNTYPPFEFRFGSAYNVVEEHKYSNDIYYYYFGMGLESILNYVGDSAVVKLIVPGYSEVKSGSATFSAASTFQSGAGDYKFIPIFYDRVRYSFYK
jgi:hypothetical protein